MVVVLGELLELVSDDEDNQMIHQCATWTEFQQMAPTSAVAIIVQPELSPELSAMLRDVRNEARLTALILVTSAAPDNARHLGSVLVDEVVWHHEPPAAVREAIRRAQETDLIQLLVEQIRSVSHLPKVFTNHILTAMRAEPPIKTVKRWGYLSGRTPRALQKQWRRHVGERGSPREFLTLLYKVRRGRTADSEKRATALAACREILDLQDTILLVPTPPARGSHPP